MGAFALYLSTGGRQCYSHHTLSFFIGLCIHDFLCKTVFIFKRIISPEVQAALGSVLNLFLSFPPPAPHLLLTELQLKQKQEILQGFFFFFMGIRNVLSEEKVHEKALWV